MGEKRSRPVPNFWNAFAPIKSAQTYPPGSLLFEESQPAAGIYMIEKGQVEVAIAASRETRRVLASVGPGTMLGLSEAISGGPHKLSARTLVQTELFFVPRERLMNFLAERPKVCMEIVRTLSDDLHSLYHQFRMSSAGNHVRRRAEDGRFQ
jgi:CRP-like cAMP-binding protein